MVWVCLVALVSVVVLCMSSVLCVVVFVLHGAILWALAVVVGTCVMGLS